MVKMRLTCPPASTQWYFNILKGETTKKIKKLWWRWGWPVPPPQPDILATPSWSAENPTRGQDLHQNNQNTQWYHDCYLCLKVCSTNATPLPPPPPLPMTSVMFAWLLRQTARLRFCTNTETVILSMIIERVCIGECHVVKAPSVQFWQSCDIYGSRRWLGRYPWKVCWSHYSPPLPVQTKHIHL